VVVLKFEAGDTNNYHCASLSFKNLKVLTRSREFYSYQTGLGTS